MENPDLASVFRSVSCGDKSIAPMFLQATLKASPDAVNWTDESDMTLLAHAAMVNRSNLVQILLDHGAKPDVQDEHSFTPLMWASVRGHNESVEALLKAGANVNLQGEDGLTALTEAIRDSRKKTIELLLDHGANINLGYDYRSNLHLAIDASGGSANIIKTLIARGIDLHAKDEDRKTPLEHVKLRTEYFRKRGDCESVVKQFLKIEKVIEDAIKVQKPSAPKPLAPK